MANDCTVQSGSFGVDEDIYFDKVSKYARAGGYPRLHIASNSGARIGLAEEVKPYFQIAWNDPAKEEKVFVDAKGKNNASQQPDAPERQQEDASTTEQQQASVPEDAAAQPAKADSMGQARHIYAMHTPFILSLTLTLILTLTLTLTQT